MEKVIEKVAATAAVESVVPKVAESVAEVVTPITETVTTTAVKKGWWANSSKMTKGLVIGGALALAAFGVWYFGFRKKDDESEYNENETESQKSEEDLASEHATKVIDEVDRNNPIDPNTLPNKGVGCSEPRTAFNGDNDFIKFNGKWHVKTKNNPSNKALVGQFKIWTPLQEDQPIVEQLNSRYPND